MRKYLLWSKCNKKCRFKGIRDNYSRKKTNGRFDIIFDLCSRIEQNKVNKKVLESLIISGSFDSLKEIAQNFSH